MTKGDRTQAGGADQDQKGARSPNHTLIPFLMLHPYRDVPQRQFDERDIQKLASKINAEGQVRPVEVFWYQDLRRYVPIGRDGERWLLAASQAGRAKVRCVVTNPEAAPPEGLLDRLLERCVRQDWKPIEQARAFAQAMDTYGWTNVQLAEELCIRKRDVSEAVSLLRLPEKVQEQVEQGVLPVKIAMSIAQLADTAEQTALARQVVEGS